MEDTTTVLAQRLTTTAFSPWPVPFYTADYSHERQMISELKALILRRERDDKSRTLGTHNAKKSSGDILREQAGPIQLLQRWISDAVQTLQSDVLGENVTPAPGTARAEAWAVNYANGGYHRLHTHHDSVWSGVFYVQTARLRPGSGELHLIDPRLAAIAATGDHVVSIAPYEGLLVAFPSWQPHSVGAVDGPDNRICVAFNVGFDDYVDASVL